MSEFGLCRVGLVGGQDQGFSSSALILAVPVPPQGSRGLHPRRAQVELVINTAPLQPAIQPIHHYHIRADSPLPLSTSIKRLRPTHHQAVYCCMHMCLSWPGATGSSRVHALDNGLDARHAETDQRSDRVREDDRLGHGGRCLSASVGPVRASALIQRSGANIVHLDDGSESQGRWSHGG